MKTLLILTLTFLTSTLFVNAQQNEQAIKLDFFNKLPPQIDGCSELLTYDSTSLKKEKYIIVTDLQENVYIKVAGKQITLKRVSNTELSKGSYKSIYEGNGYTLMLTTKTLKQSGDEIWTESGTVEIRQGKSKVTNKIHGEAGC